MATTERDSSAVEAWIVANAGALSEALRAAEDELHGLLGGERAATGSVRPWLPSWPGRG
jgi:hypothetical protein